MYDSELLTAAVAQGRWDSYGPVHKGLRLGHTAMLRRLGGADWSQDQTPLLADLSNHLRIAALHLGHEEAHVHPLLESRAPGATEGLEEDHESHRARFAALTARINGLEVAAAVDRPTLGRALYLDFTQMVAEDLAHMLEEEAVVWPLLCTLFSDAELEALEGRIIGSLPPSDVIAFMQLMLPAMNRTERASLLMRMKANAPQEAFAAVINLAARPTLSAEDLADLWSRGIAA